MPRLLSSPLLALALAFSGPAVAQEADPGPVPVDATAIDQRVLANWRKTAEASHDELEAAPADAAAWATLSRALEHGGKPYAALTAWAAGYKASPTVVAPTLPRALALAQDLDEDSWLGALLTDAFALPMDAETRADLALIVARHHFREGSWGAVLGMLPLVPDNGPRGLDASVLRGTVLAQQQRYTEALPLMLTAYERARQEGRSERYVATLAMNAARTLYAAKAWEQAFAYYDRIPRSDPAWSRAQVEKAWAAFRAQDMDAVLGLLQTHEAPFFDTFYQPEAAMLRAQALYLLCKFPATTAAIDSFQERYQPILDALESTLGAMGPGDALAEARAVLDDESTRLPRMVLREVVWDGRLADQIEQAREGRHELKSLDWVPMVRDVLAERVEAVATEADTRLSGELKHKLADLTDLLSNIELTRVDLLSMEAELYQRAAATGVSPIPETEKVAARKALRRKGKRVWPFEGEFWIDELGSYQVRTPSECPEGLSRGG